jgi:hypothetical protein
MPFNVSGGVYSDRGKELEVSDLPLRQVLCPLIVIVLTNVTRRCLGLPI